MSRQERAGAEPVDRPGARRRVSRRAAITVGLVAVLVVAAGTGVARSRSGGGAARRTGSSETATGDARVVRADLRTTQQFDGTLGYATPTTLAAGAAQGTYTRLPAPGDVISQGQPVYEVDGVGVPLLYGDRPAWRTLVPGVPPGPDVAQLNTGLVALGYARGVTGDPCFTAETAAGVRRWQTARHTPVTGMVENGQVMFAQGPLRVQAVRTTAGAPTRPGEPLLDVTSITHVADLPVPVDQAYLLHLHDPVAVTLPDARTQTPGTVTAISPVAVRPTAAVDTSRGRSDTAVIDVTVTLTDPAAVTAYTTAPIMVAVETPAARGVLAVPVSALVATPNHGYAVTVLGGTVRRQVPVQTGLFADTLVEVSGPGLAEGQTVEVPAS